MLKKLLVTIVGLALLIGFLAWSKMAQFNAMGAMFAAMVPPPETVTSATVSSEEWEETVRATGTLVPVQGVTVTAEVAGKVSRIEFEPGATVAAGALLVQLDISTEEAQLRAAESQAQLARVELARQRDLLASKTISQAEFDAAEAKASQSTAQSDTIKAQIAKKTIRAPFAGRLGLRQVNLGQVLRDGDPITSLQTLDPIYVNFSLPQQRMGILTPGATVRVTTDAAPGDSFAGKVGAVSPEVDVVTRSIRAQATLANPAAKLRPGMYATVEVVLPRRAAVLSIPATAVVYAPFGDSVFVIEEKKNEKSGAMEKVIRQQFVRLGSTRGDFVAVASGLKAGDVVVSTGVFKLAAGMAVTVDNTLAPPAQLSPTPANE